ncbi:MAG: hypothetical protein HY721_16635 [Planctomycetes bacterium]|nr:hypothetical protein [Planctomycetota bacterium]
MTIDPQESPGAPAAPAPHAGEETEAVYVLVYDEELTYLVNEGVVRPGMMPSELR